MFHGVLLTSSILLVRLLYLLCYNRLDAQLLLIPLPYFSFQKWLSVHLRQDFHGRNTFAQFLRFFARNFGDFTVSFLLDASLVTGWVWEGFSRPLSFHFRFGNSIKNVCTIFEHIIISFTNPKDRLFIQRPYGKGGFQSMCRYCFKQQNYKCFSSATSCVPDCWREATPT